MAPTGDRQARPLLIAGAIVAGLALAGAVAYIYFFSSLRATPKALSQASAVPAVPAVPSLSPTAASQGANLAGDYTTRPGSLAGYRVREQFAGQPTPHEAVARTSSVTGSVSVAAVAGQVRATALRFSIQLADLASVDQVAGFNVTQRDRLVRSALGVAQFPTATFEAAAVPVPADLTDGRSAAVTVPGQLTIHGIARAVAVAAQIQLAAGVVTVSGSVPVRMSDFGIAPPQAPFVAPESNATVEFQLVLARS